MGRWIDAPVDEIGRKFTQEESMSLSVEEQALLHALIRMGKPQLCFEIGTGNAVSTRGIGRALAENGEGRLLTCETSPDHVRAAAEKTAGLPVDIQQRDGLEILSSLEPGKRFDFLLLDGGYPSDRLVMLKKILADDRIAPGGLLVVHDALNPNDGDYRPLVSEVRAQRPGWACLVFHSVAGIAVFQRPE